MPAMFDPLGRKRRSQLLRKYATLTPNGDPVRCRPVALPGSRPQQQQRHQQSYKIIFTSEQKAVAFAQATYDKVYESTKQYPYLCEHPSTDGSLHWHLTSKYKSNAERKQMRLLYFELQRKQYRKEADS